MIHGSNEKAILYMMVVYNMSLHVLVWELFALKQRDKLFSNPVHYTYHTLELISVTIVQIVDELHPF